MVRNGQPGRNRSKTVFANTGLSPTNKVVTDFPFKGEKRSPGRKLGDQMEVGLDAHRGKMASENKGPSQLNTVF